MHDPLATQDVGDALRFACGVSEEMSEMDAYRAVRTVLSTAIESLPKDMATVARGVFGLDEQIPQVSLRDRMNYLSKSTQVSERTLQRRIEDITKRIALQIADYKSSDSGTSEAVLSSGRALVPDPTAKFHATVDRAEADAVSQLVKAIDNIDSAIIQIGSILVAKFDGMTIVRSLSASELAYIEENPLLLAQPHLVLKALQEGITGRAYKGRK
jgi:hypothetical protein